MDLQFQFAPKFDLVEDKKPFTLQVPLNSATGYVKELVATKYMLGLQDIEFERANERLGLDQIIDESVLPITLVNSTPDGCRHVPKDDKGGSDGRASMCPASSYGSVSAGLQSSGAALVTPRIVWLTMGAHHAVPARRKDATAYSKELLGESEIANSISHAIPIGSNLKVHFNSLCESSYVGIVQPAFSKVGTTEILNESLDKEQREIDAQTKEVKSAQKAAVGNVDLIAGAVSQLSRIHGDGGRGSKRRRFARRQGDVLAHSHRVAASGLAEAKSSSSDDDSQKSDH